MGLNTTPRTWVAGETVTAAEMNTEIGAAFTGLQAAWVPYTPSLTGFVQGNGTLSARYRQIGKTVQARIAFLAGSTSTFSTTFQIAGPSAAGVVGAAHGDYTGTLDPLGMAVGSALVCPAGTSAGRYPATAFMSAAGNFLIMVATGAANAQLSNTVPASWVSGGFFSLLAEYELA